MAKNIIAHNYVVTKSDRQSLKKHRPLLLWFTGLSGSGKSTIANKVEQLLAAKNIHTYTLDGDNVRKGLNNNLSFSPEDRTENIRRVAETANLMVDAGLVVLAAFVSPYIKDRAEIRRIVGDENMVEVYVNTSLGECMKRDVKGLYQKALKGEIKNMTGLSAPYEAPVNPEIEIHTEQQSVEDAAQQILDYIQPKLDQNI
ncbi:MAG: adenylyl-sulfate kinase [Bacteroidetes bacterium MedPE-SWsnd-G2]|nr:MAG: adenylyl-sulfate kinase [Bacteroidetes bacterium MedPE-SWsnd-G2]